MYVVARNPIVHCVINNGWWLLVCLSLINNLSIGLKELTCHKAMNLASYAFPQHHHVIFSKVGQFVQHDFSYWTHVINNMAVDNGCYC